MRSIHLIERVADPALVYETIRSESPTGSTVLDFSAGRIGAVSPLDPGSLPGAQDCEWVRASDFESDLADKTRKEYVRLTHELGSVVVQDNKNIKELLSYGNEMSLWWLSDTSQKHAINFPLRWCLYCCEIINFLLDSEQISEGSTWYIWVDTITVGNIYKDAIGSRGNVIIRSDSGGSSGVPRRIGIARSYVYIVYVILRAYMLSLTYKLVDRLRWRDKLVNDELDDVVVISISDTGWKKIPDPENHSSKIEYYDSYMGYMPWDIESENIRVSWIRASIAGHEYSSWKQKCENNNGMRDASAHAIIGLRAAFRIFVNTIKFVSTYNDLVAGDTGAPIWRYKNIELDALILRDLRLLCARLGVNHMVRFEQYRRAIETICPVAVLYKSEMFIPGRLITAAVKGRTRLIALQHGIHIDEAVPYQFDSRDVGDDADFDHIRFCPMPDVFAAFGEYAREQFAEWGGYPASRVVPVGGVRHDHLVRTLYAGPDEKRPLRARLRDQLGVPDEGHVVLLCTQQRQDVGKWFDLVLRGLGSARESTFVAVQLHHAHGGAEQIHAVAAEHGFDHYRLFDSATYPLIACSDVVVTGPSTIILESILLDTPAISIAASGSYETYPYQREGLATIVASPADMEEALRTHLRDNPEWSGTPRREQLLRRHLWNYDACACARLVELIYGPAHSSEAQTPDRGTLTGDGADAQAEDSSQSGAPGMSIRSRDIRLNP